MIVPLNMHYKKHTLTFAVAYYDLKFDKMKHYFLEPDLTWL